MLIGLLLAGNLAGFGGTSAPAPIATPSGGWEQFAELPYRRKPTREEIQRERELWGREDVQAVVAEAATVAAKPNAKPRLAALQAEIVALAQTVALRNEARDQFMAHVAAEARRRDDDAAMLLILFTD